MAKELRMPSVGDTLKGVYKLQGVLGEGGFGKAFSGTDLENNVPIAVKVLQFTSAREILKFSLEGFRMSHLTHPNIVKVIDYDAEVDTYPYIVMPLAPNGSLEGEIRTRRGKGEHMPIERSIAAIEQIGDALAYLHQKRIVHQDVKPDNILLPNERDFWLSDLGIAKILNPDDPLQIRHLGRSPHYASPEQSEGKAVLASDQYSLGITAFQLLTGRLPFITALSGEFRVAELELKHRNEKPPSLVDAIQALKNGERMITILRVLDPIVQTAIAKKPEDRYDTVMTFAKTLKKTAEDAAQEKPTGKPFPGVDVPPKKVAPPQAVEIPPTLPVVEDIIKRCVELYEQERYVELLEASDRATILDPNNADAWMYKGLSLCRFGKWEETLEPYDRAIELDPTNVVALRNKADSLNRLGRHEEALHMLGIALRLSPTYLEALNDKGSALNSLGRHEEAIRAYDQAIRVNPGYSKAFNNKGVALNALGRNEEAIAAYDQAIKLNPGDSEAFNNKGVALNALGRNEEAIAAYDQAIKLNPGYSNAFAGKGATLCAFGKYKEASLCFQQAMASNPSEQVVRLIDQVKKIYHLS